MSGLEDVVLHNYWRSSSSWRVRLALEAKGVSYTYEAVHLVKDGGQQHTDAYSGRNAMRQVPTLEATLNGEPVVVAQSMAIMELLSDVYPDPPILPTDQAMRARCRQLAEIVNSGIQPLQNLAFLLYLRDEFGAERAVHSRLWIEKGLDAYVATLPEHDGLYSVPGEHPSIADFCLIPQLYNSRRFALDLEPYPRLLEIEAACAEHPWFEAAHPDRMPDAQPS